MTFLALVTSNRGSATISSMGARLRARARRYTRAFAVCFILTILCGWDGSEIDL